MSAQTSGSQLLPRVISSSEARLRLSPLGCFFLQTVQKVSLPPPLLQKHFRVRITSRNTISKKLHNSKKDIRGLRTSRRGNAGFTGRPHPPRWPPWGDAQSPFTWPPDALSPCDGVSRCLPDTARNSARGPSRRHLSTPSAATVPSKVCYLPCGTRSVEDREKRNCSDPPVGAAAFSQGLFLRPCFSPLLRTQEKKYSVLGERWGSCKTRRGLPLVTRSPSFFREPLYFTFHYFRPSGRRRFSGTWNLDQIPY